MRVQYDGYATDHLLALVLVTFTCDTTANASTSQAKGNRPSLTFLAFAFGFSFYGASDNLSIVLAREIAFVLHASAMGQPKYR